MSIRLEAVVAAARAGAASLPAEMCGYIALRASDELVRAPRMLTAKSVELTEDGSVHVVGGDAADEICAEASVRVLLREMLGMAPSTTPSLRRAAGRGAELGVRALTTELEAALVPVNRAAAKRGLARLYRESVRAQQSGAVRQSGPPAETAAQSVPVAELPPVAAVQVLAPACLAPGSVAPEPASNKALVESSTLPWVRPRGVRALGPEAFCEDDGATHDLSAACSEDLADCTEPMSMPPQGDEAIGPCQQTPEPVDYARAAALTAPLTGPTAEGPRGTRTPPLGTAIAWLRAPPPAAGAPSIRSTALPLGMATEAGELERYLAESEAETHVLRCQSKPSSAALPRGPAHHGSPEGSVAPSGDRGIGRSPRSKHPSAPQRSDVTSLVDAFGAEETRSDQELCLELQRLAGLKLG